MSQAESHRVDFYPLSPPSCHGPWAPGASSLIFQTNLPRTELGIGQIMDTGVQTLRTKPKPRSRLGLSLGHGAGRGPQSQVAVAESGTESSPKDKPHLQKQVWTRRWLSRDEGKGGQPHCGADMAGGEGITNVV